MFCGAVGIWILQTLIPDSSEYLTFLCSIIFFNVASPSGLPLFEHLRSIFYHLIYANLVILAAFNTYYQFVPRIAIPIDRHYKRKRDPI